MSEEFSRGRADIDNWKIWKDDHGKYRIVGTVTDKEGVTKPMLGGRLFHVDAEKVKTKHTTFTLKEPNEGFMKEIKAETIEQVRMYLVKVAKEING